MRTLRWTVVAAFVALIALGLAWELWLAPLRPGGSMLALKVFPLCAALAPLARGRVRTFQWWSMLILLYLMEGLVRATSDAGLSARLAAVEAGLAALAFVATLAYLRQLRRAQAA